MAETEYLIGLPGLDPSLSKASITIILDSTTAIPNSNPETEEAWYSSWPPTDEELLPDRKAYNIDLELYATSSVAHLPEIFSADDSTMEALKKGLLRKVDDLRSINPSSLSNFEAMQRATYTSFAPLLYIHSYPYLDRSIKLYKSLHISTCT